MAHPLPTTGTFGTASPAGTDKVVCQGTWILSGHGDVCPDFPVVIPNVIVIPTFRRRSLSPHGLKLLGYDATHNVAEVGNTLRLRHCNTNQEFVFPCVTHHNSDFVALRVDNKALVKAPAYTSVSAVDIANTMQGTVLFHLLHLRL